MARPKTNPDYNPEKARDDLVKAVADFYTAPPSDEMAGKDGKTKMKFMQQEFGLSMSKIRKLLVTAGVYKFEKDGTDMVSEIANLRTRGLTDEQIMAELAISAGTLSSLTPYKAGVYNADFTVGGYDMTNVSTDARRKRSQRKREKMKEGSVVETHKESIEDLKRKMDEQKYPGMTSEEIEIEKARRRAENEAKHQANLERKRKHQERKAEAEEMDPGGYLRLAELLHPGNEKYKREAEHQHELMVRKQKGLISEEVFRSAMDDIRFGTDTNSSYVNSEARKAWLDEMDRLDEERRADTAGSGRHQNGAKSQNKSDKVGKTDKVGKAAYEKIGSGDNVMYAPAIDYAAYDRMTEDEKQQSEELEKRILEYMAREEEIELPEIDVETFGTEWISTKSVKGRPIGDFIFEPDFNCKYKFPDGDVHKLEPGSAVGVIDANHEKHIFGFEILGPTVAYIFRAFEIKRLTKAGKVAAGQPDTEYEFSVMGDITEQDDCIGRLVDNAVLALQNLTITRSGRSKWGIDSPSQCLTDKYVLSANEIGRIKFVWSGRESGEVYFQVDGHTYTPEDAVKLFSAYEGWEMQYAIRSTEDILTNDMTLYPVLMNEDTFVEELGNILMALTDRHEGKFLRQEEVSVFDIMLEPVLKKLRFYYNEDRKQGEKSAASMIKLLKSVGTDSAVFPEYEIKQIKDTVK